MRRLPLLTLALVTTTLLGGCNFFNRGNDTDVADVPVDEAPVSVDSAPEGEVLPTPAQSDFADPVVPADDVVTVAAPDLIQSTDPNERAIGVQRSRPDPFASLPIPPTPPEPVVPATASGARAQPANAANQGGAAAATAAQPSAPNASSGGGAATAANRTPVTPNVAAANPATALPPIPQPTAARAVRISGVVQIGGTPYAIVQTPNEVERYVRAGERIAGGSVLVKRIDTRSVEPRVVLEENGIEVVANVSSGSAGVAAEPPAPPSEPQAALVSVNRLTAPDL